MFCYDATQRIKAFLGWLAEVYVHTTVVLVRFCFSNCISRTVNRTFLQVYSSCLKAANLQSEKNPGSFLYFEPWYITITFVRVSFIASFLST